MPKLDLTVQFIRDWLPRCNLDDLKPVINISKTAPDHGWLSIVYANYDCEWPFEFLYYDSCGNSDVIDRLVCLPTPPVADNG